MKKFVAWTPLSNSSALVFGNGVWPGENSADVGNAPPSSKSWSSATASQQYKPPSQSLEPSQSAGTESGRASWRLWPGCANTCQNEDNVRAAFAWCFGRRRQRR
eukprot:SAG22_NODE_4337_length_1299_cov_1.355833_2_plen_104_part_00